MVSGEDDDDDDDGDNQCSKCKFEFYGKKILKWVLLLVSVLRSTESCQCSCGHQFTFVVVETIGRTVFVI